MDLNRVAEVYCRGPGGSAAGSGYLVAPGLVFTAWHVAACAAQSGSIEARFVGDRRQGRAGWSVFDCRWHDAAADLALLRLRDGETGYRAGDDAAVPFGRLEGQGSVALKLNGFPLVQRDGARTDTLDVHAECRLGTAVLEGRLHLQVRSQAPRDEKAWAGISGAAVFRGGHLVAVVIETSSAYTSGVLVAQPLSAQILTKAWAEVLGGAGAPRVEALDCTEEDEPSGTPPWDRLYDLAYMVNRRLQAASLRARLVQATDAPASPRAHFFLVFGTPEDEHADLITRFRVHTVPGALGDLSAYASIEPIVWPGQARSMHDGLARLGEQLASAIDATDASPRALAQALDRGDKPRAFWTELQTSRFGAVHRELLPAWIGA
jgi:hypothetical protein